MAPDPMDDLPEDWARALEQADRYRRIMISGPTDVGKSRFIHALGRRRPGLEIVDLDPGQKMIGAPGTASRGRLEQPDRPDRFVWLGSSAVGSFRALAEAAARLTPRAAPTFAANLPGYVTGPGLRLQHMLADALAPDLILLISPPGRPVRLDPPASSTLIRLAPSLRARRKSPAVRRRNREASFARSFRAPSFFDLTGVAASPGPPWPFETAARPLCALADAAGEDRRLAILVGRESEAWRLWGDVPDFVPASLRLGSLWAAPQEAGWRLLEPLAPAWEAPGWTLATDAGTG